MNSFEKISKMNLAELDRPNGQKDEWDDAEEEQQDIVTVADVEDGAATVEDAEKQQTEVKKEMRAPEGTHYFIDAKVTAKEITAFLFAHTYRQPLMMIAMLIAVIWPISIIIRRQSNMSLALVLALFILIILPLSTWNRGKKTAKDNPIYKETFHYMVDEWGLHLELGKECVDVEWAQVRKVTFLKSVTVVYTGKTSAFLIPSASMEGKAEEINAFIKKMRKK